MSKKKNFTRSGVQAGAESVAAPLVSADARNLEVLPDLQPVDAGRDLVVPARRLDAWTDVGVPPCDAVFVAASGTDNLTMRYATVGVDPVAPPPTVGGGRVGDLLAVASLVRTFPLAGRGFLAGDSIKSGGSLMIRKKRAIQFTVIPPQHLLYFFPDPQGHGSFRPTLGVVRPD